MAGEAFRLNDGYPISISKDYRISLLDPSCVGCPSSAWISRGLVHFFGFHHEEAIVCFREALKLQPSPIRFVEDLNVTLLLHLLIASSSGPNYNFHAMNGYYDNAFAACDDELFPSAKVGFESVQSGLREICNFAGEKEGNDLNAILHALLSCEFFKCMLPGLHNSSIHVAECGLLQNATHAYRRAYEEHGDNEDVAFFTASTLMLSRPWGLFTHPGCQPTDPALVKEIRDMIDKGLETSGGKHIGLCHLKVHLEEMGPQPESALKCCDTLRRVLDASHLLHMATHIDCLVGDFESAARYNCLAIHADVKMCRGLPSSSPSSFFVGYMLHDFHMLTYACNLGGFEGKARWACNEMQKILDDDALLKNPMLLKGCEAYRPLLLHVLMRFGRYDEILEMQPSRILEREFCVSSSTLRAARSLAFAVKGRCLEARAERAEFNRLLEVVKEEGRFMHNNTSYDLLKIDGEKLMGEILFFEGKREDAFNHLRNAVVLNDNLKYDEPLGHGNPARHALGALLIKAAGFCCADNAAAVADRERWLEEARAVFLADLKFHPKNPWALRGLADCLKSQARHRQQNSAASLQEIDSVSAMFHSQRTSALADVDIKASCCCAHHG